MDKNKEVKVISYTLEAPKMETYIPNTPLPDYDELIEVVQNGED